MPTRSLSPALAACVLLLVAPCSHAADLAARSRLGAIFAEPPARVLPPLRVHSDTDKNVFVAEAFFTLQPRVPGYYGRAADFEYRSYYGTSPLTIFGRDPYACTLLSQC